MKFFSRTIGLHKLFVGGMVFFIIFSWIFSGHLRFFNFPPVIQRVQAASAGDMAIYRDANGTFDTNVTHYTGVPFNNVLRQDSGSFRQSSNEIDIALGRSGHYLFGYVVQARNNSYNNRIDWLTQVTLAGKVQAGGQGQGYRRNSGNDRFAAYGYGLVEADAGDEIRLNIVREGSNASRHLLEADRSSFWLLKLDEAWDYLSLQGADNQPTPTDSYDTISLTAQLEKTSSSVFGHDTGKNPEQITLKAAGHYMVIYTIGVDGAANRTSITGRLTLAGRPVEQSYDYSYIRGSQGIDTGIVTAMTIVEASAHDILRLEWGAIGAVSAYGTQTESHRTALAVIKLPDNAAYLRVHESGSTQDATVSGIITHNSEDEEDLAAFSHNTVDGRVTVQQAGDYLFTYGGRTNRGTTGATRLTMGGAWYVNDVRQLVGNTLHYVRGNQGTPDTFDGGHSAAVLLSALKVNDIVDFRMTDEGQNGNHDMWQIDAHGITAVNIDSLFSAGALSVDIVDAAGTPTAAPTVSMTTTKFIFDFQTTTGALGLSTEKIRVTNGTATAAWTLTLAATRGASSLWVSDGNFYDFNDATPGAFDGGDADVVGGELTVDPAGGIITPQPGCSTTGVALGSAAAFNEGVSDSVTLMSANGSAATNCYWDLTNVGLAQLIPAQQAVGTYTIDMTLTAS
jgi:hypothetical protein